MSLVLLILSMSQVEEVTWGYKHPLVDMANLILPEDQKLPELYGYFYGETEQNINIIININ